MSLSILKAKQLKHKKVLEAPKLQDVFLNKHAPHICLLTQADSKSVFVKRFWNAPEISLKESDKEMIMIHVHQMCSVTIRYATESAFEVLLDGKKIAISDKPGFSGPLQLPLSPEDLIQIKNIVLNQTRGASVLVLEV